jgi:hypothetical protein
LFSLAAWSPHEAFAQACRLQLGGDGDPEMWLEGTVGDSNIRVYLNTEPDGRATGTFYDLKNWSSVFLDGARGGNCGFRLTEKKAPTSDPSRVLGSWEGAVKNGVFEGEWRSSSSGPTTMIKLQKIPAVDCDGKGKWAKFTSPEFPISFEYPENWRIVDPSAQKLLLQCPDPRIVQFPGTGISMQSIDATKDSVQIGPFTKYRGTWLVVDADIGGPCDSLASLCSNAKMSKRDDMTVVYGSRTNRLFRVGDTYQRLGEEQAYVLVMKARSVYVSSVSVKLDATARILRSAKPTSESPR